MALTIQWERKTIQFFHVSAVNCLLLRRQPCTVASSPSSEVLFSLESTLDCILPKSRIFARASRLPRL
jgi:hypothetical protein